MIIQERRHLVHIHDFILYGDDPQSDGESLLDGNDIMIGAGQNNVMDAGSGNDFVIGGGLDNQFVAGDGDDIMLGLGDFEYMAGDEGNDSLFGFGWDWISVATSDALVNGFEYTYDLLEDGFDSIISAFTNAVSDVENRFVSTADQVIDAWESLDFSSFDFSNYDWGTGEFDGLQGSDSADTVDGASNTANSSSTAVGNQSSSANSQDSDSGAALNDASNTTSGASGGLSSASYELDGVNVDAPDVDTGGANAFTSGGDGQSSIDEMRSTDVFDSGSDNSVDTSGGDSGFTTIGTIMSVLNATIGELYEETFIGGEGDDLLEGGIGTDYLYGGTGADTYVYWLGDGSDTINEAGSGAGGGSDTIEIRFSDAIYSGNLDLATNLDVSVSGDDMTLSFQFSDGIGGLMPMGSITIEGMGNADTAVETLTLVNDNFSYDFDLTSIFDAADNG